MVNVESELKKASKLSDVKEPITWYSLQFPELSKLRPRVGHALVSQELGKVVLIGGGNHEGALQEIVEIDLEPEDGESLEGRVKEHPAQSLFNARYEFSCAKDKNDKIWMFGGADTQVASNEVVVIDKHGLLETVKSLGTSSAESSSSTEPCPRTQGSNAAIVGIDGKEYLTVFAGGLKGEQPVGDRSLYLFDTVSHEWRPVNVQVDKKIVAQHPFGCQPPTVQGHIMTAFGSKVLVHGGINNLTLYDGFHYIDLKEQNEESSSHRWIDCTIDSDTEKPSGRAAHAIAKVSDVDPNSPIFYMFGGLGKSGACNDLWSFNFESMSWKRVLKNHGEETFGYFPVPRLDLGMCSVGLRDQTSNHVSVYLIIHGGMNPQGELYNDAWVMKVK